MYATSLFDISCVLILCCAAQTLLYMHVTVFNPHPGCTPCKMMNCLLPAPQRPLAPLFHSLLFLEFYLSSVQVMKSLEDGYRLPPPVDCPSILYELMKNCWSHDRMRRPQFHEIQAQLQHFISSPHLLRSVADFDPR